MSARSLLPCPICGSAENETLLSLDCGNLDRSSLYPTVRLRACLSCGHVYNDLSTAELAGLETYYEVEYAPANLNAVTIEGDLPGSTGTRTQDRYAQLYQVLSPHIDVRQQVLDVGCALGGFLDYLQGKGLVGLHGVDMTRTYVERARSKTRHVIEYGKAESLPFEEEKFGLVVLEQVLEHLADPAAAFREARRVLRMGGVFCVGVPDASRYSECHYFDYYWLLLREHIQHFDVPALGMLAAREGFQLLEYQRYAQPVMGQRMVMPNLCAVFRRTGLSGRPGEADGSGALRQQILRYLERESFRLQDQQTKMGELAESRRPVYVWGAGREFLYLYEAAGLKQCSLAGIIDMNPFKQSTCTVDAMRISSSSILSSASRESVVLITALAHAESIRTRIEELGFPGETMVVA